MSSRVRTSSIRAAGGRGARRLLAGAAGGAAVVALTACAAVTPIERLDDPVVAGTTAIDVGPVKLRGLVVVGDGRGPMQRGSLVLVAINTSSRTEFVRLRYPTRQGRTMQVLRVPPGSELRRGTGTAAEQLIVQDLRQPAGAMLPVTVTVADQDGLVDVPLLTDSLPQYASLTPAPVASPRSGESTATPLPLE